MKIEDRIVFDETHGAFPLRAITPDGTEWAVNKDLCGLFSRRKDGTWEQHEGTEQFRVRGKDDRSGFSRKLRARCGVGPGLCFATWHEWRASQ